MDGEGMEIVTKKRMKPTESSGGGGAEEEEMVRRGAGEGEDEEDTGSLVVGSEEMEMRISRIFEKIERFTQQVSEMLEAGKTMFKNLSSEFEERLITIHREQIEKWQEEIKDLRLLDVSNEEANALLHNTRYHLLQNVQMGS